MCRSRLRTVWVAGVLTAGVLMTPSLALAALTPGDVISIGDQQAMFVGAQYFGLEPDPPQYFANIGISWVPNDPRRISGGSDVRYMVDGSFPIPDPYSELTSDGGLGSPSVEAAIDRGVATIGAETAIRPGGFSISKVGDDGGNHDLLDNGFPDAAGPPTARPQSDSDFVPLPDIIFGGFFDAADALSFFSDPDYFPANGPQTILGVTFPFVFVHTGTEIRTDINLDGRDDYALAEIYFNDLFDWADYPTGTDEFDGTPNVFDIETVALHEFGHAVGLGHESSVPPPGPVMHPNYMGVQRVLKPDDLAGLDYLYGAVPEPSSLFLWAGLMCLVGSAGRVRNRS